MKYNHVYEPVGNLLFCRETGRGMFIKSCRIHEVNYCPMCGKKVKDNLHIDKAIEEVERIRGY